MVDPGDDGYLSQTLTLAGAALGERVLDGVPLGGSTRSLVLRARRDGGTTVVIKRFCSETEPNPGASGFTREVTGLELLDRTPELLAVDADRQVLVMSDLGAHPTLADLLRGTDPDGARLGALDWATALGELIAGASAAVGSARERLGSDREQASRARGERVRLGLERLAETAGLEVPSEADRLRRRLRAAPVRDLLVRVRPTARAHRRDARRVHRRRAVTCPGAPPDRLGA